MKRMILPALVAALLGGCATYATTGTYGYEGYAYDGYPYGGYGYYGAPTTVYTYPSATFGYSYWNWNDRDGRDDHPGDRWHGDNDGRRHREWREDGRRDRVDERAVPRDDGYPFQNPGARTLEEDRRITEDLGARGR